MNQPPQNPYPYPPPYPVQMEDEISLIDLWRVLTKRKTSILLITLLTTLGAIIYALTAPAIYRAEVLMVSAQSEKGGGGMAALASQFGGLAGMAGISLGGAGGGTETALAVLQSRSFAQQYIQERNLKPLLFPEQWDQEKGQWIIQEHSLFTTTIQSLKQNLLPEAPTTGRERENSDGSPSDWEAYKVIQGMTKVSTDKKTGMVTLAIELTDPYQAARWANDAVERLNAHMRRQAIKETKRSIHFLEEELARTSLVNAQNILYNLIEEQTKNVMLANVRDEYAFKIIDPAVPPEERIKPKRKLIVILGFVLGLMLGIFIAFFRNFLENQGRVPEQVE